MPRDHAVIRVDIWNDDDFRNLTGSAQFLYLQLLSHPSLSYAGVADWRPARIAGLTRDMPRAVVVSAAAELAEGLFVVIDEGTEEVLIRSFLKHDGLLQKPNVAKAMVSAYSRMVSPTLRGVLVFELRKLHDSHPEWNAFRLEEVQTLLGRASLDPSENPSANPSRKGPAKVNENSPALLAPNSLHLAPTSPAHSTPEARLVDARGVDVETATQEAASAAQPRSARSAPSERKAPASAVTRGSRIDRDFAITDDMRVWAREKVPTIDIDSKLEEFVDYWLSVSGEKGVKLDWVAAWRNGMKKQVEFQRRDQLAAGALPGKPGQPPRDPNAWMQPKRPSPSTQTQDRVA